MATLAPKGIDVRQTLLSGGNNSLVFRASVKNAAGQKVTTGNIWLYLYAVMNDGTLRQFDFSTYAFLASQSSTPGTAYGVMTHQQMGGSYYNTGIWTFALAYNQIGGFTQGGVYIAQVTDADSTPLAVPVDQEREFQFGGQQGDGGIDALGNPQVALPPASQPVLNIIGANPIGSALVPAGYDANGYAQWSDPGQNWTLNYNSGTGYWQIKHSGSIVFYGGVYCASSIVRPYGFDPLSTTGMYSGTYNTVSYTFGLVESNSLESSVVAANAVLGVLGDMWRVVVTGTATVNGHTVAGTYYFGGGQTYGMPYYYNVANQVYLFYWNSSWWFSPTLNVFANSFSYSCTKGRYELPTYPSEQAGGWTGNGTYTGSITTVTREPLPVYDPSGLAAGSQAIALAGGLNVTLQSPVTTTGDIAITQNDDYLYANNRQIGFTNSSGTWAAGTIAACYLTISAGGLQPIPPITGVILSATGNQSIYFNLTAAQTALLTNVGRSYIYQVLIEDVSGHRETDITGAIVVSPSNNP